MKALSQKNTSNGKQSTLFENIDKTYKSLFDNHPDLVFILDLSGNILSYNRHINSVTGYKEEEIFGSFEKYIVKNCLNSTIDNFLLTCSGQAQSYETALLCKDGSALEINVTNIPIIVGSEILGIFGIAKEISKLKEKEIALEKVQNSLNNAQIVANIGSWDYDIVEDEAFWSNQMYCITGIDSHTDFVPTYSSMVEIVHPKDRKRYEQIFNESLHQAIDYEIEYRIVRPNGEERIVYEKANLIIDENQKPVRVIGIIHDITEKRLAEKRLKENEQQFQTIFNNLEVGIWSINMKENEATFISDGVQKITGYSNDEIKDASFSWEAIIFPEDLPNYLSQQKLLLKGNHINHQYRIIHKNNEVRWVQDNSIPYMTDDGEMIRKDGIISDITNHKTAEEQMLYFARYDYLTDLPNKRMFDQRLIEMIEYHSEMNRIFGLIYLDMDRFKYVNDTLGHRIGDELLKQISIRLTQCMIKGGFLARLGSDEFGILYPSLEDTNELITISEKIISALKKPFMIQEYELFITTSIGISLFPNHGSYLETLLKNADTALHRAKELGKDNYIFYLPIKSIEEYKGQRTFMLEKDLRNALSRNEFCMYFQPKVDVFTNKIVGAEALIRWNHKEWGLVSPQEFIPLAEETGLIIEIGNWVVRNVCEQLRSWKENRYQVVPISINISPKNLLKKDWGNFVTEIVKTNNLDPTLLEFEITESTLMQNEHIVRNTLNIIKDLGIKLSLDDFGTGFSSITYLKQYQFHTIKIDRSFIKNIVLDPQDSVITNAIIELAHGLNMKVVAEGVETEEQFILLNQLKCDEIQGFYFSKPVCLEEFETLLLRDRLEPKKID